MNTRTTAAIAAGAALFLCLVSAPQARAASDNAKWWAEEQKCINSCPKMPRFSGTETDEQFKERIRKTDEYNACQHRCTQEYLNRVRPQKERFDDGSEGYFKRNE